MPTGIYQHHKSSEITKKKISDGNKKRYIKFPNLKKQISESLRGRKYAPRKGKNKNRSGNGIQRKRFANNRYKARKKKAEGFHTFGEWELLKKQYGYTCLCCERKEPQIQLSEDHIIPLSKGGSDNIENIQPLCRSCNCKKHTKIIKF